MPRLIAALCTLLICAALPARADWTATINDDGALFYGTLRADPAHLFLTCVERSRGMVPLEQRGAHEIGLTPPFALRLELTEALIPDPGEPASPVALAIWVDGRGFAIPRADWNQIDNVWSANIAMTDPLVTALRGASDLIIGQSAGPHYRFATAGIGLALQQVLQFCSDEYTRLGHPLPPALTEFRRGTTQPQPASQLDTAMQSAIAQTCAAGAQLDPSSPLRGDIDGDGIEDLVLDWRAVRCSGEAMQFHCGASQCGIDIYLSRQYPLTGKPESVFGIGARLNPLSNGLQGVAVGGSLRACMDAGRGNNGCEFIWYWTGSSLELIR